MTATPVSPAPSAFHALLEEQVGHESTASQQYVAIAVWYDQQALPQQDDDPTAPHPAGGAL